MVTAATPRRSSLKATATKVAGVGAVLVAGAGVINGAIDLTKAIFKIPTNVYDKTNEELFKIHFNKKPVLSQPVEIKSASLTVQMLLQVYESGDLFVRYGDFQQWLPFKAPKSAAFSLFSQAYAQVPSDNPRPQVTDRDIMAWAFGNDVKPIVIDIEKLKAEQSAAAKNASSKQFVFSEIQTTKSGFYKTTQTYEQVFKADAGYKFSNVDLELGSANNSQIRKVEVFDDGKAIRVEYSLTSGPLFDQYRGWIHGTVNAKQERAK